MIVENDHYNHCHQDWLRAVSYTLNRYTSQIMFTPTNIQREYVSNTNTFQTFHFKNCVIINLILSLIVANWIVRYFTAMTLLHIRRCEGNKISFIYRTYKMLKSKISHTELLVINLYNHGDSELEFPIRYTKYCNFSVCYLTWKRMKSCFVDIKRTKLRNIWNNSQLDWFIHFLWNSREIIYAMHRFSVLFNHKMAFYSRQIYCLIVVL